MKIRQKLTLGFAGIALLVGLVGYLSVKTSQTVLEENIGKTSAMLVSQILTHIESVIYSRIEHLQTYTQRLATNPSLVRSNQAFTQRDDRQDYIDRQDQIWRAADRTQITDFMADLIDDPLSEALRNELQLSTFYRNKYDYEMFAEVFVTNQYGVNVGQTRKTSDYYQADETWWQKAKQEGLYVADVAYDQSAGVYSIDICIRINDDKGNFLGVMKAVSNVDDLVQPAKRAVEEVRTAKGGQRTVQFKLLTGHRKVIFATEEYGFLESLSPILTEALKRGTGPAGTSGFFIMAGDRPGQGDTIYAYAHSRGYKDFYGLKWTLLSQVKTRELFAPVAALKCHVLIIALIASAAAGVLGPVLSNGLSSGLTKLVAGTAQIGAGLFTARIALTSHDEIGQLAAAFNTMAENLDKTTTSVDTLSREIAERQNAEANLKAVFNAAPVGMMLINENTQVVRLNHTVVKMTGRDEHQLLGLQPGSIFNCVHAQNNKGGCGKGDACGECPVRGAATRVLESNRPLYHVEVNMHLAIDRKIRKPWLSVSLVPISIEGKKHVVIAFMDITQRRENEERLRDTLNEVERYNRLMRGREERVIEIKKDVNALLAELGRGPHYQSVLDTTEEDLPSDISEKEHALQPCQRGMG